MSSNSIPLLTQMVYDYGEELEALGRNHPQTHWIIAQAKTAMRKLVDMAQDKCYTLISSGKVDLYEIAHRLGEIFNRESRRIKFLSSTNQAIAA